MKTLQHHVLIYYYLYFHHLLKAILELIQAPTKLILTLISMHRQIRSGEM
jgi:hypothetical protein